MSAPSSLKHCTTGRRPSCAVQCSGGLSHLFQRGNAVYCLPHVGSPAQLAATRSTDASNLFDEEAGVDEQDFSGDEAEQAAKKAAEEERNIHKERLSGAGAGKQQQQQQRDMWDMGAVAAAAAVGNPPPPPQHQHTPYMQQQVQQMYGAPHGARPRQGNQ